ncbi:hypothetical protein GW17_00017968 [Ensete ventricosum]|nr:hypothetical protein GW17_00017968 [Ensete ventricosum]
MVLMTVTTSSSLLDTSLPLIVSRGRSLTPSASDRLFRRPAFHDHDDSTVSRSDSFLFSFDVFQQDDELLVPRPEIAEGPQPMEEIRDGFTPDLNTIAYEKTVDWLSLGCFKISFRFWEISVLANDTVVVEADVAVRRVIDYWSYDSKKETGYAVYHMPTTENDMPSGSIPLALQSLFYKLQYSDGSVATKDLTKSFGWDTYDSFMQHDVQELNRVLCEKLEDKMKLSVLKEITNIMQNSMVYSSLCTFQDAKKGVLFTDFPPVLQLQLKRFEYDFMRDTMIKVGTECNIDRYCPYRVVRTGPPVDQYADRPLIVVVSAPLPLKIDCRAVTIDFDRWRSISGSISRGREKEEEGEEKPGVRCCSSPARSELLQVLREHKGVEAGGRKGRVSDDESIGAQLPKSKALVIKEVDSKGCHNAAEADLLIAKKGMQMQDNEYVSRERGRGGGECRGKLQVLGQGRRAEAKELHKIGVNGLLIKIAESGDFGLMQEYSTKERSRQCAVLYLF